MRKPVCGKTRGSLELGAGGVALDGGAAAGAGVGAVVGVEPAGAGAGAAAVGAGDGVVEARIGDEDGDSKAVGVAACAVGCGVGVDAGVRAGVGVGVVCAAAGATLKRPLASRQAAISARRPARPSVRSLPQVVVANTPGQPNELLRPGVTNAGVLQ